MKTKALILALMLFVSTAVFAETIPPTTGTLNPELYFVGQMNFSNPLTIGQAGTLTFTAASIDQQEDVVSVLVDWGDNTPVETFAGQARPAPQNKFVAFAPTHAYLSAGTFKIKFLVVGSRGNYSRTITTLLAYVFAPRVPCGTPRR